MIWFRRNNGRRRRRLLPGVNGQESAGGGIWDLAGRSYDATRFLCVVLFVVVAVAISDLGHLPPDLRIGRRLEHDVRARVNFNYPDAATTNKLRQREREKTPRIFDEEEGWVEAVSREAVRVIEVCASAKSLEEAKHDLRHLGPGVDLEGTYEEVSKMQYDEARKELIDPLKDALRTQVFDELTILGDDAYAVERAADRVGVRKHLRRRRAQGPALKVEIVPYAYDLTDARNYLDYQIGRVFSERSDALRDTVVKLVSDGLSPNVSLNAELTHTAQEAAADSVTAVIAEVKRGEVLVRRGDVLSQEQYDRLEIENDVYQMSRPLADRMWSLLGVAMSVLVVVVVFMVCAKQLGIRTYRSGRRMAAFAALALVLILATRWLALTKTPVFLAPAAFVAIIAGLMLSRAVAIGGAVALAIIIGIVANEHYPLMVALGGGGVVSGLAASQARRPADILKAGVLAGMVQFAAIAGMDVAGGVDVPGMILGHGAWGILSGVGSGLLVMATLSAMELVFGFTTKVSLLELTDQNQPLLRQLILGAPGTYHHSFIVGNLAEAGAEAIGADQLLARTSSYYHDVGKLTKPEYYSENEPPGRSRHDRLTPAMSTLIITSHVKDGIDLAREYRLPKVIRDIIEQHHGTSRVEYFFRQAKDAANGGINDEDFRYPGPKPRTREAGVVLLADTIEAASRSLEDPSPARVDNLVHQLAMSKLLDGQFDECELTLKELGILERTFVRVLTTMYHRRVQYPGDGDEKDGSEAGAASERAGGGEEKVE